jgi:hypothetical protein
MSNVTNNLRDKTDEELIGMMRKLALERIALVKSKYAEPH